jgi:RNA polymerase-binding transcription factor DksA
MNLAQSHYVRAGLQQRKRELSERRRRVDVDLARAAEAISAGFADAAVQLENDESLHAIDHAAESEILEINEALHRLDEGTYGLCKHCGKPISPMRLAALPQAVTCTLCPGI